MIIKYKVNNKETNEELKDFNRRVRIYKLQLSELDSEFPLDCGEEKLKLLQEIREQNLNNSISMIKLILSQNESLKELMMECCDVDFGEEFLWY